MSDTFCDVVVARLVVVGSLDVVSNGGRLIPNPVVGDIVDDVVVVDVFTFAGVEDVGEVAVVVATAPAGADADVCVVVAAVVVAALVVAAVIVAALVVLLAVVVDAVIVVAFVVVVVIVVVDVVVGAGDSTVTASIHNEFNLYHLS
jgi:hypothetical protein